jgi:hypothetical protein
MEFLSAAYGEEYSVEFTEGKEPTKVELAIGCSGGTLRRSYCCGQKNERNKNANERKD